jgi:hypothetical protein
MDPKCSIPFLQGPATWPDSHPLYILTPHAFKYILMCSASQVTDLCLQVLWLRIVCISHLNHEPYKPHPNIFQFITQIIFIKHYKLWSFWLCIKTTAFSDIAPYSLLEVNRRFIGAYYLHHQNDHSETSMYFYETIPHTIPGVCHLHTRRREDLKCHSWFCNYLRPHIIYSFFRSRCSYFSVLKRACKCNCFALGMFSTFCYVIITRTQLRS